MPFLFQEITGRGIPEAVQEKVNLSEVRAVIFLGALSKMTSSIEKDKYKDV